MSAVDYQMKIAICDDDEHDRQNMRRLVTEYIDAKNYHIKIDEYISGESFLESDVSQYDLVILDIFMDELNGIETARRFVAEHPNMQIIFCSSSNAYAEESYDVFALRYLAKPVEREKLFVTLDRFFNIKASMRTLVYKQNRMDEWVFLNDVIWVEADGHCSIIHTKKEDITTRTTFSQICDQVNGADFVKPIRYALVSLRHVVAIPTDVFLLSNGATVPISRDLRSEMKKAFSSYKMKELLSRGGIK